MFEEPLYKSLLLPFGSIHEKHLRNSSVLWTSGIFGDLQPYGNTTPTAALPFFHWYQRVIADLLFYTHRLLCTNLLLWVGSAEFIFSCWFADVREGIHRWLSSLHISTCLGRTLEYKFIFRFLNVEEDL